MLFQELGKLKRSSIMTSIILMAVGILMIICPKQYVNALVATLGYGALVFAVVMILDFISGKKALTLAGIDNVDQIKAMTDAQLSAIPGMTEKDLKRIRTVLSYDEENS